MTVDEVFDHLAKRITKQIFVRWDKEHKVTFTTGEAEVAAELAPLKAVVEAAQHAMSHGHCDEGRFGWIADVKPLDAALAKLLEGKEREG